MQRYVVWIAVLCVLGGCGDEKLNPVAEQASPPIIEPCTAADCPPCGATQSKCADDPSHIAGSCCSVGDALVRLDTGSASEVVDIVANDRYVIACGGFGASVNDIANPTAVVYLGSVGGRCQRAAFGGESDAGQIFYITHHGDSWIAAPSLATYIIAPDGAVDQVDLLVEDGVLYEGPIHRDGFLYVAAHGGGVRVYGVGSNGAPSFIGSVSEGLGNPWKLDVDGDQLFVADNALGVAVLSLANPSEPSFVRMIETAGSPVDVDVTDKRVYVAQGGFGVEVFDRNGTTFSAAGIIDTGGTAQAIAVSNDVIAVAAWSHVALYDDASFVLLATQKIRGYPAFEQDVGIAMIGDTVIVGEWEEVHLLGYRQGFIAADVWTDEQHFQLPGGQFGGRAVIVRNLGHLPLRVDRITTTDESWSADRSTFIVPRSSADFFELSFSPPGPEQHLAQLSIASNDPDMPRLRLGLVSADTDRLDIGDALTGEFGFLDPSGAGELSGLDGHVVVLAYFALF